MHAEASDLAPTETEDSGDIDHGGEVRTDGVGQASEPVSLEDRAGGGRELRELDLPAG